MACYAWALSGVIGGVCRFLQIDEEGLVGGRISDDGRQTADDRKIKVRGRKSEDGGQRRSVANASIRAIALDPVFGPSFRAQNPTPHLFNRSGSHDGLG